MTEWLEYTSEWGYWINPDTFRTPRIKKSIRVGAVFFEKNRETLEDGRQVIVTTYGIARAKRAQELGKREASEILAKQMVEFMKTNKMYPPNTAIKKVFQNGNVDLNFEPSEYDKFSIRIIPKMVGGNVEDFLDDLANFKEPEASQESAWKIEPAKSGRSTCRTCGRTIDMGHLRIGEPDEYDGHVTYRWHHVACKAQALEWMDLDSLDGYSDLTPAQRSELERAKSA